MKPLPNENCGADGREHRAIRLAFVIGAIGVLVILRIAEPVGVGKWLPFQMSCAAVTGLPCIFCGMTRALHALLNGNVSAAIYFNWLVFPFLGVVVFLVLVCMIEIATRRTILTWNKRYLITARKLTIIGPGFFLLWALQVYLAVSQHKHELLNPAGPLYALFVR